MFRFFINLCGNDNWTSIHFSYLNDLCTCSDLDQNTSLIEAFSSKVTTYSISKVNKFLALLPGIDLVLGGNVENLGDLHILVYTKISQQVFDAISRD